MKHENSVCKRLRKVGVNALQLPIMSNEWWRSAVIYQIYPRSFADLNGDGIGDLPGITSRLEALGELGINAVWLSPFMASPQKDAGYDVADYCSVDPIFGTLADFDRLLATAKADVDSGWLPACQVAVARDSRLGGPGRATGDIGGSSGRGAGGCRG